MEIENGLPSLNNKYRLDQQIGEGGFGEVYVATDLSLERKVAIKLLKTEISERKESSQRFLNEARLTSKLTHPNTLTIYDFGTAGNRLFLVSELLDGEPLSRRINRLGAFQPADFLPLFIPVCYALFEAHQHKVIHRDLKPENLFIHKAIDGEKLVLLDFGIAKSMGELHLTQTGQIFGTPYYMAPEQIRETKNVDHRTDIYSLGIILYEALSGEQPYSGNSLFEVFEKHIHSPIPLLAEKISVDLAPFDELIASMMAKEVSQRPQSTIEVATWLKDLAHIKVSLPTKQLQGTPPQSQEKEPFFDQTLDIVDQGEVSKHSSMVYGATDVTMDAISSERLAKLSTHVQTESDFEDLGKTPDNDSSQQQENIDLEGVSTSDSVQEGEGQGVKERGTRSESRASSRWPLYAILTALVGAGIWSLQPTPTENASPLKAILHTASPEVEPKVSSPHKTKEVLTPSTPKTTSLDQSTKASSPQPLIKVEPPAPLKIENPQKPQRLAKPDSSTHKPLKLTPPSPKVTKITKRKPKTSKVVKLRSLHASVKPNKPQYNPSDIVSLWVKAKGGVVSSRRLRVTITPRLGKFIKERRKNVGMKSVKVGKLKWSKQGTATVKVCYRSTCDNLKFIVQDLTQIDF